MAEHWFERQPLWFKTAVFYEIHTRAFFDSTDDGSGDFRGLTQKLDYLQWLGIDCIWLLPFYPSPLRDGGYDIADFYGVHPDYGTLEDFRLFVEAAHERGMRVIADLVMNHTSSDHQWFQESRSSPDSPEARLVRLVRHGAPLRGRAHHLRRHGDVRTGPGTSTHRQYYWHRFFHHQPDLNYESAEVQEAMLDVLRFWLDLGLDGFRLDAVPYLFEEEGTICENLPPTHAFLKRVRAEIDANYPDRVLLAEANQWPEDVVAVLRRGDGDECHMAFHFPVMPRMFMALRREEAKPLIEILDRTPAIPPDAQWGLFLRNHDELTLEMVTDEERDYMVAEYAKDPRMKLNVGIRRRLAPLLDGGRDEIELMHAILFSLPGSPVIYYGDEIGMGDNVFLGDRDGVRTPMQWTGDRNAGFSRADFAQLYLPTLMDPVFGYQAVNVEAQLRSPTSLLRWLRRFIELRKEHPVFGHGDYEALRPENPRVFAHVRGYEERHRALCAQPVPLGAGGRARSLSLARPHPARDARPQPIPPDRRAPVPADAGAAGFFWFQLIDDATDMSRAERSAPRELLGLVSRPALVRGKPATSRRAPMSLRLAYRRRGARARARRGAVPRGHARDLPRRARPSRNDAAIARASRAVRRIVALAGVETPCTDDAAPIGVEQSNSLGRHRRAARAEALPPARGRPEPEVELLRALDEAGSTGAPAASGRSSTSVSRSRRRSPS